MLTVVDRGSVGTVVEQLLQTSELDAAELRRIRQLINRRVAESQT